jgi:fermentation-respiration switch protein FrsA (DUF1100 family)
VRGRGGTTGRGRGRLLRRIVAGATAVLLLVVIGSYLAAGYLIHPMQRSVGAPPPGLPAQDVLLTSDTGRPVHGWLVPGQPDRPGVLLLHGLWSDRRAMVPRAEFLHRLGYTVLLIDLQGEGESPGEVITFGHLESADARAAVEYLRSQVGGRPVGAIGVSLGGAALVLADRPLGLSAVVLESVYDTIGDAVDNRMSMTFGPAGPWLSPLLVRQLPWRLHLTPDDLAPIRRIAALGAPLLMLHGDLDQHTTLPQARRLFDAAAEPKQLWVLAGAGHVDLCEYAPQEYRRRVGDFLAERLAAG